MKPKIDLKKKLNLLPKSPGCYIFKDQEGKVLYIGKAISLNHRVRSYFQKSANHTLRISRMVHRIEDLEWIVVESELEALVLECNLIKEHRPFYNVRLRDDKNYPYIAITKDKFPRVLFTRQLRQDGTRYFGPYTSAYTVRDILDLLHKIFPLIPCGKKWSGKAEQRPCLYYHMSQCFAPCAGLSEPEKYLKVIDQVAQILSGKGKEFLVEWEKKMHEAAEKHQFELAAKHRDRICAVETLMQKQSVLSTDQKDRDVIAVVKDERGSSVQMLYIRSGKMIGQRHFFLDGADDSSTDEAVSEFIKQYYTSFEQIPREILLPVEVSQKMVLEQWLKSRRGSAVSIHVPRSTEGLRLLDLAAKNADQALGAYRMELEQKKEWAEDAMIQLQEAFKLPRLPLRIEGYDISNIQGQAAVGSMVVTENGKPEKSEYRKFKIKHHGAEPNDFAMIHEVITRRLKAYLEGDPRFQKLPDLIMVDGGKGQLMAALKARDELNLTIPMVGLAKKFEILFLPHQILGLNAKEEISFGHKESYSYDRPLLKSYTYEAVELSLTSPGLFLLRKLRDEAHRFAVAYHRKVRKSFGMRSLLDEVPGIGPRRRNMLLRTFGSIEAIQKLSVADLAAVPTMTKKSAESVLDYLSRAFGQEG